VPVSEKIEETASQEAIRLTQAAIRQAQAIIRKQGSPDETYLRLGVRGGGCSGLFYSVTLDNERDERDHLYEFEGVRVLVDRKSMKYLAGTELDYDVTNLLEGGFRFRNPNAKRSCGCGISFQA
jgi:iron-sulfur cluster assembly protein